MFSLTFGIVDPAPLRGRRHRRCSGRRRRPRRRGRWSRREWTLSSRREPRRAAIAARSSAAAPLVPLAELVPACVDAVSLPVDRRRRDHGRRRRSRQLLRLGAAGVSARDRLPLHAGVGSVHREHLEALRSLETVVTRCVHRPADARRADAGPRGADGGAAAAAVPRPAARSPRGREAGCSWAARAPPRGARWQRRSWCGPRHRDRDDRALAALGAAALAQRAAELCRPGVPERLVSADPDGLQEAVTDPLMR